jgi:uncharacterized membrane protein (Fun14 family)
VALTAMALGVGLYVIPLSMIANESLIRLNTEPTAALIAFAHVAAGLSCLSFALIGRSNVVLRAALFCAGLMLSFLGLFY